MEVMDLEKFKKIWPKDNIENIFLNLSPLLPIGLGFNFKGTWHSTSVWL